VFSYFRKMKGNGAANIPRVTLSEIFWGWFGAVIGISTVAYIDQFVFANSDLLMIIGSFGASAVLIYGAIKSPLAQPRNLVGGHILSALVGVTAYQLIPDPIWLSAGLAVATAIAVMLATKTVHPPGGATALIAVIGSTKIHDLGYLYTLMPVGLGALIMLLIALLINNIPKGRRYPEYWF